MTTTDPMHTDTLTETAQLREQLLQAQKLSSVGALASSVAHEFNNILTTIINYAKLGLKAGHDAERHASLERILKAGHRAAAITSSMLGFARRNSQRREMHDVVALVEEVLVLTQKDLQQHRIQVEKTYMGRPRAAVVAGQIEQVLLNLVINARQSMPRGGTLHVDVRSNPQTQMVEIRVADTGCGIAADKLRLIFEPFYTTKRPDENGHGGTGLGLSVCRQIIEQHQGRIRVESLAGKGSAFTVKLPLEAPVADGGQARASA
ncbi:MAG TPA: ATP-binding protein [Gemmatales bacterium]|nr:ATP-binding protein [Gemmatales bacterium]HMP60813.1 ATP-binding protein [Gemmatales bacterium]